MVQVPPNNALESERQNGSPVFQVNAPRKRFARGVRRAADYLDISESTFRRRFLDTGMIVPQVCGRLHLFSYDRLDAVADSLPEAA